LAEIGEDEVDAEVLRRRVGAAETGRHRGEEELDRQMTEEIRRRPGGEAGPLRAVPQLESGRQVNVAPRARFGAVTELIVGAREQLAPRGVVRVGEDEGV